MTSPTHTEAPVRWRPHTAVLAFGAFAVGTDGFVVAGLLPSIATSLHVSVAAAGQLVTVFSISYAVLAPVLAALTASWPRRRVLVTALAVFAAGNAITALAPSYDLVLASRVVAAAGAALFTATASATAALLAGDRERGRAISIVMLGVTTALVLGAPLGTLIGGLADWRAAMWLVTALALVAAPAIGLRLPSATGQGNGDLRAFLAPLRNRRIVGLLVTTVVAFTGIYIPYTYVSEVFAPAYAGTSGLAVLLLVYGLSGTVGNLTAGHLADRYGPRRVIVAVTLILAAAFALTPLGRGTLGAAVAIIMIVGFLSFSVTTPQQHLLITLAGPGSGLITSLYQSALYLAVSLSGGAGALALEGWGAAHLPHLAAVLMLAAATLTVANGTRAGQTPRSSDILT
ncbi:MFS transporter [Nonomuraea jiangxiensis]|uniref:MFS transporter, DHA1 family, inner membrane transport protein n=1 Tax=Nonomuraea jiangxiensis TaxID=633440 RepID=A0A1G8P652_9ACTN|nr:MFS transporter [Nonomuraea jiangxiensis]SDI87912.1 MFS transporter, DHA1 family, inner membrane transport protein [Nonomuraea jiangxiensis]